MKRFMIALVVCAVIGLLAPIAASAYNFGDYRSVTLTTKGWNELEKGDIEAVLAYTNKCIELYGEQARKMQIGLSDYPTGSNQEIFSFWALNDIATCLFIQGEAYKKADMVDEAKEVYQKVIDDYTYGQCWDPKGWFWKPAEVAKERLAAIESGSDLDFGDNTSETLTTKAWQELNSDNTEEVMAYTNKCLELYSAKAKEMQSSLSEYPSGTNEKIFEYWALNDVGTCLFIQGEALRKVGENEKAKEVYNKLIAEYSYAQCWDPKGWFWKPAEAAQSKLAALGEGTAMDFGDYTSETLTTKAWGALNKDNLDEVLAYTNKCLELYTQQAKEMQGSLTEYPWESKEKIFSHWALNDVGTCLFIKGEAFRKAGETELAKAAFKKLADEFSYAQCWDPQGWFWKPAEAAQQKLNELMEFE